MNRRTGRLAAGLGLIAAMAVGLAGAKPAAAHHFGRFGFGFPVLAGPAVYVAPAPVYPVYAPPPVVYGYGYGYGYRRVYVRRYYRHVVHHVYHPAVHHYCGCYCCR